MNSATIIHGGIGTGKTTIGQAMAAAHPNMKVYEVESMKDVYALVEFDSKLADHPIFVCGSNFHFSANDLANAMKKPAHHMRVYYIHTGFSWSS